MDLILWRHAEAEEGSDDMQRALTRRGQKQASAMATWLRKQLPDDFALLASEALRSQQTAALFAKSYEVVPALNPDASVEQVLSAIDWPRSGKTIVLVGPTLYRSSRRHADERTAFVVECEEGGYLVAQPSRTPRHRANPPQGDDDTVDAGYRLIRLLCLALELKVGRKRCGQPFSFFLAVCWL